jgi:NAD(P)-dependent dehydrogenase (short-subunit alcohol dehydrogenase family)
MVRGRRVMVFDDDMHMPSVDGVLDALVVPGFSRVGYAVRSRSSKWTPLPRYSMSGKTVVLTGHTSGIGRATAVALREMGAELFLVGRDEQRSNAAAEEIRRHGSADVPLFVGVADMGELDQVRAVAHRILEQCGRIDGLVHNAGALLKTRARTSWGEDQIVAAQVVGPHVLTSALLDAMRTTHGRVITVASGGMYPVGLPFLKDDRSLAMPDGSYDGTKQYAIAKRAQVTLNEIWAVREPRVHFHAMHPGWADTPGVASSIPGFRRVMFPLLRSSEQGADTVAWLAADPRPGETSGLFWCDREVRPIHRLPATKKRDTGEARQLLWNWVERRAATLA